MYFILTKKKKDNRLVYWDASGGLSIYHATNNESTTLVPADVLVSNCQQSVSQ
jgi:hypothetical protein